MPLNIQPRDPWAELAAAETMLAILVDRSGGRAEFTLEELETPKADGWEIERFESFASLAVAIEVRKPQPIPALEAGGIVDAELVDEPHGGGLTWAQFSEAMLAVEAQADPSNGKLDA